jgi:hypothetical protein
MKTIRTVQFIVLGLILIGISLNARAEDAQSSQQSGQQSSPAPAASPAVSGTPEAATPFAFADFSWVPGNYGPSESPLATKYFVPEIRLDTVYHYDFSNPKDHTISGSSEAFRSGEFQVTQIGVGGDFNYNNVQFRLMTQFGMYSTTTPRNDASPSRGQWDMADAYRYISEAYAGYHLDVWNGINIQAGIFMSYVGLWSYYNFDNWTYQPSYVSSNTPWFFNGIRVQMFPTDRFKVEAWIVNGWQSYGTFNQEPGLGLQLLWRPTGSLSLLGNQYYGADTLDTPDRHRIHTDDSIMVKYSDKGGKGLSQAAASLTVDAGCETGGGTNPGMSHFIGLMAYNRFWFNDNHYGLTFGGGAIQNPGRYLVLLPPINGATAGSGSAYFSENPGDPFWAWDTQITGDYMPNRNLTFRVEYNFRYASVPYFAGSGGMTPTLGNTGTPNTAVPGFTPDLSKTENRLSVAMMIRF